MQRTVAFWSFAFEGSLCRMVTGESSALGGLRKGALSNQAGEGHSYTELRALSKLQLLWFR